MMPSVKTFLKNKNSGFTLLELVIVIVIIGVLTALALPRLFWMIERTKVQEVVMALDARRKAVELCALMNNISDPADYHKGQGAPGAGNCLQINADLPVPFVDGLGYASTGNTPPGCYWVLWAIPIGGPQGTPGVSGGIGFVQCPDRTYYCGTGHYERFFEPCGGAE